MFRNYLIIALRNIVRHKLYSFINIAGLAVGLTCVILIALFVRDELSYDKWIPGSDKLYRVEVTYFPPGRPAVTAGPDRDAGAGRHARQYSGSARRHPAGQGEYGDHRGRPPFLGNRRGGRSEFPAGHPAAADLGRSAHRAGASGIGGADPDRWRGNISATPIRSARRSRP